MAFTDLTQTWTLVGNGVSTELTLGYFLADDDLVVQHVDENVSPSVITPWVKGTHFTLSGAGDENGGTLTIKTTPTDYTPAVGEKVIARNKPDATQPTGFEDVGHLGMVPLERAFDRAAMVSQKQQLQIDRAIGLPDEDTETSIGALPKKSDRADSFLKFDANGDPVAADGISDVAVSSAMSPVVQAVDLAAARNAMGVQADLDVPSQAEAEAGTATTERVWTAQRVAQAIAALATSGLPRGYLAGLDLSNGTDADHDIDIAAGECRDAADSQDLVLSTGQTKQIDASWATGTNAGGLASALTLSADTTYHVFITDDGSSGVELGFDTSLTATNLLSDTGGTKYRRIGSVITDGSSNILAFHQDGDEFIWDAYVADVNSSNPGTSEVTAGITVPTGIKVRAILFGWLRDISPASGTNAIVYSPDLSATPVENNQLAVDANAQINTYEAQVLTNTSAQVKYKLSQSTADHNIKILTKGWIDRRGRDS